MDEQDAGPALFDKILDNDVIHLRQLFPAMIKFLECTERELPHGCQPAETRNARLSGDKDHYLTVGGKINKNYAKHVLRQVRQEFQQTIVVDNRVVLHLCKELFVSGCQ